MSKNKGDAEMFVKKKELGFMKSTISSQRRSNQKDFSKKAPTKPKSSKSRLKVFQSVEKYPKIKSAKQDINKKDKENIDGRAVVMSLEKTVEEKLFPVQKFINKTNTLNAIQKSYVTKKEVENQIDLVEKVKQLSLERDKFKLKALKLKQHLNKEKSRCEQTYSSKRAKVDPTKLSYYKVNVIGEGNMAVSYSGTYNNQPVIVKKLQISGQMTSSDCSYLIVETSLLLNLNHKNVVGVVGVVSNPLDSCIVVQHASGKTLKDIFLAAECKNGLPLSMFFKISISASNGLNYLHEHDPPILHLNLKPSNIIIEQNGNAKICDYGFSKLRINPGLSSTIVYLAPEMIKHPFHITTKNDVYAFGIILWEMMTGKPAHQNRSISQILETPANKWILKFPLSSPIRLNNLVEGCWNVCDLQRPSFKEIFQRLETIIPLTSRTEENLEESLNNFFNNSSNPTDSSLLNIHHESKQVAHASPRTSTKMSFQEEFASNLQNIQRIFDQRFHGYIQEAESACRKFSEDKEVLAAVT